MSQKSGSIFVALLIGSCAFGLIKSMWKEEKDRQEQEQREKERIKSELFRAVESGDSMYFYYYWDRGSYPINGVDENGDTLLHKAVEGSNEEIIRCLIKHPEIRIDFKGHDGDTPLHRAARAGQKECIRILLEGNASVSAVNDKGETPLHLAVAKGDVECVRILLEHRASVRVLDNEQDTPMDKVWDAMIPREDKRTIIDLLKEHGAK